jgi:hypothetical protein
VTGEKHDKSTGTTAGAGARTGTASPAGGRRRLLLAVIAALVVIALVVVIVLLNRNDKATDDAAAAASTSAATDTSVPSPLPTPTPTGPTGVVDQPPAALPEVPLDASAAVGNGIVAALPKIDAIEGTGTGPGNIAGPALRVTVRIKNGTSEAVSLGGVAVNMSYGADKTPASPLDDPSRQPFDGMLAAGASADGVYVFSVPKDARGTVTVEVGYQAGAPLLLFTGPVG